MLALIVHLREQLVNGFAYRPTQVSLLLEGSNIGLLNESIVRLRSNFTEFKNLTVVLSKILCLIVVTGSQTLESVLLAFKVNFGHVGRSELFVLSISTCSAVYVV
jgi:hypothetical protein